MTYLKELASTGIGKVLIGIIIVLIGMIIALGIYTLIVSGERNVLDQTVKTKEETIKTQEETIARKNDQIKFQNAWLERDKIDASKKDEEFKLAMAAKPVFKTKIEYIPTGNKCVDYDAIVDEARGSNHAK